MDEDRPLWQVVGGADRGGILVRSGQEYTSTQYESRLSHGARVKEVELRGDRLHYEKLAGDGPDYGWISIKLKGKDLVVRDEGLEPEEAAGWMSKFRPDAATASDQAEAEPLAAVSTGADPGTVQADAVADVVPEICDEMPKAEAGAEEDIFITVESMTAAGPPQELTDEERERIAEADKFKADMALEEEARRRCEVPDNRDVANNRGAFLLVSGRAELGGAAGAKVPFVDAFNGALTKIRQELAKKDCPGGPLVEVFTRFASSAVMLLNAMLPCRFRVGTVSRFDRLVGLLVAKDSGACPLLQAMLKEERVHPNSVPTPVKSQLGHRLAMILEVLGQLPHLVMFPEERQCEEGILNAIHGYLAFFWYKVLAPTFGVPPDKSFAKPPADPTEPQTHVSPEFAKMTIGKTCHWIFAVLFCGGEMLPDVVFFRPSGFSLRWRLMKTSFETMTQLLSELRARFSEDEFQQRYKAIRKNAGPGDEDAIIACALSVQSVVLPRYGFAGDVRGVMEMRGEVAAMTNGLHDGCNFKVMRDIHRLLDYGEPLPKLPFTRFLETPRFAPRDRNAWLQHLNDQGFAVLAGVANLHEVETALDLLWTFIEQTDASGSVRRDDVTTWADQDKDHCGWPAGRDDGIIHSRGIGQSQVLWFLRALPLLKNVFGSLWGTDHLVPSFDGAGVFRPYGHKGAWRTKKTNWWHVDQAHRKRGLHCVQGLLTLTDCTPATGGLVVVPGSHRFHGDILNNHMPKKSGWDYIGLEANEKMLTEGDGGPRLVSAKAGDLLLWDSRTVHCNTLPLEEDNDLLCGDQLLRAVAYVCMTPAAWCTEKVAQQRAAAFKRGVTTSHWPHEFHAMDIEDDAPSFELSKVQRELLSPQTAPGWREENLQGAPKQGRISLFPEAKYRVVKQGGVNVRKSATTEWGAPVALLKKDTEVRGYAIGRWLRLGSWPRGTPLPAGIGDVEEDHELWAPLSGEDNVVHFSQIP